LAVSEPLPAFEPVPGLSTSFAAFALIKSAVKASRSAGDNALKRLVRGDGYLIYQSTAKSRRAWGSERLSADFVVGEYSTSQNAAIVDGKSNIHRISAWCAAYSRGFARF
jgi:hypothetical protein